VNSPQIELNMNELEYQKVYHDAYSSFIKVMDKELDNAGKMYAEKYASNVKTKQIDHASNKH